MEQAPFAEGGVALKVQIHRPLPEDSLAEGHIAKRLNVKTVEF